MPTYRQKATIKELVENGGNISKAMLEAGYSPNTAKTPQKLTESIGFKELCEVSGLTDALLIESLVEDIKTKKGNRKAELELGFKIKGRLTSIQEKEIIVGNPILFTPFSKDEETQLLNLL